MQLHFSSSNLTVSVVTMLEIFSRLICKKLTILLVTGCLLNEPRHDKSIKISVRPVKTQISLGIRPVWSESSLSAWRNLGSLATLWADSEDSDQTGRMPRLIWVFAGRTLILLILSCRGLNCSNKSSILLSYLKTPKKKKWWTIELQ